MEYLEEEAEGLGKKRDGVGGRNGVQIVDRIYLKTKASGSVPRFESGIEGGLPTKLLVRTI